MALIDQSYFIGELNIPNTSTPAIGELLDWFIEKYERQFLEQTLGVDLYRSFVAGLAAVTVDQIWLDLLNGVDYIDRSNKSRTWRGLVTQPPSVINALDALNTIDIIVGGAGTYDPVAGGTVATIPATLVGKDFIIEQRAVGQLRTDEYTVVGNVLTLLGGKIFSVNDTYFYKSATLALNTSTGINKESPIAGFVYYHFVRNNHSQTATMGEVKTKNENATSHAPTLKMVNAWNEMSRWVWDMRDYLDARKDEYTDWSKQNVTAMLQRYRVINEFNI